MKIIKGDSVRIPIEWLKEIIEEVEMGHQYEFEFVSKGGNKLKVRKADDAESIDFEYDDNYKPDFTIGELGRRIK